jgi:hypothetical protein
VTGRRGKRRKQLPEDFQKMRGYWKLIEEAPNRTLYRTRFGTGYGPKINERKNEGMNEGMDEWIGIE